MAILAHCAGGGGGTVGQKGEVSQKFAKAYEFAFGSEVAETAERTQGTFWINMFLKSICEQNLISEIELHSWMIF